MRPTCGRDHAGTVDGSGWSLVALTVFKTVRDLTLSGWVGSIPMHSRQVGLRFGAGEFIKCS